MFKMASCSSRSTTFTSILIAKKCFQQPAVKIPEYFTLARNKSKTLHNQTFEIIHICGIPYDLIEELQLGYWFMRSSYLLPTQGYQVQTSSRI